MTQRTYTMKVARARGEALEAALRERGWSFRELAHAHWQARGEDCIASWYRSGKLVVQGRDAGVLEEVRALASGRAPRPGELFAAEASEGSGPFGEAIAKLPAPTPQAWIGIDETGKGDYFGPLVVCAARVESGQLALLEELGAADSKSLKDRDAHRIARDLAAVVPHEVMVLRPETYNELYAKIGNLNQLLAWAHAKCASNLLKNVEAELILSDAFSKRPLVREKLSGRARSLRYQQRTRAEDDPAVACASIFARARFLEELRWLERTFDVKLHKGAGPPVLSAGRLIVKEHGAEKLRQVAKLHFKTTQRLVG